MSDSSSFEKIEEEELFKDTESVERARKVLEMKPRYDEGIRYQEASVSLWDFAGQFVYYATHQLFFSPRCIYLLVLNIEDDLEKTMKDWYVDIRGKESIETKGGINFWLRSILTYAKGSSSGVPPILLVGTHSDKLKWGKSKIGMRITRYSLLKTGMVDPYICDSIRRYITSAVKKEFTRFHVTQNEKEEKHFEYQIQCKVTDEKDILDEGLHYEKDLLKAINTDFFCAEHSDRVDPHSLKPVGMLHEWFNDKIPQNFRLEDHSVFDTWIKRLPNEVKNTTVTLKTLSNLTIAIGNDWRKLMKVLGVKETQLDQIEINYMDNVRLQKFYGLYHWKLQCQKAEIGATNDLLLRGLKQASAKGLEIDFEEVQNVFDDLQK